MDLSARRMALARERLRNHPIDCTDYNTTFYRARVGDVFVDYFRLLDIAATRHSSFNWYQTSLSKMYEFQDGTLPSKDRPHLPLSSPKSPYTTADIACVAWRKAHITAIYYLLRLEKKSTHHETRNFTGKLFGRCHHGLSLYHDSYQNMASSVRRRKGVYLSPPARPHHHKLPHVPSTC